MIKRGLIFIAWLGIQLGLLSLGFWQLNRAEEKQTLLDHFTVNQQAAAAPLANLLPVTVQQRYQKIIVQGHFDNQHSFLIDNRTYNNQVGYYVITPFVLKAPLSTTILLINRGFVPRGAQRADLPRIPDVTGEQTITAIIDFPSQDPFLLGENYDPTKVSWPLILQQPITVDMSHVLHQAVYPFIALLYDSCCGFQTDWQPAQQMPPSTHHGYAVQWFALAVTWLILTSYLYIRRKRRAYE